MATTKKSFLGKAARNAFRAQAGVPAGKTLNEWSHAVEVSDPRVRAQVRKERTDLFVSYLRDNGYSITKIRKGLHV